MRNGEASRLHGKERIDQLREAFPQVPLTILIKADVIHEGLKHTRLMDEVGRWAIPDVHELYENDYEDTHSRQAEAKGHVLTPFNMYFRDGVACLMFFNSSSPYEVKYEGRGCFMLYRDQDPIAEVRFPPCPQWHRKTTSSGKVMSSVIALRADRCLAVTATNYCEYFRHGEQCMHCNINPTAAHFAGLGQKRALVRQARDVYETYLACATETGVEWISLSGGAFHDRRREADLYIGLIGAIKRAMKDVGEEAIVHIGCQAMDEEDQLRLREAGAVATTYSLEVWDQKLFGVVCPGKAKHVGRDRWIEAIIRAVDIFGRGRVVAQFVLGVELCAPFGFENQEEALDSNLDGWKFLMSHGVRPVFSPLRNAPGSNLATSPRPSAEYVLKAEVERKRLLANYGLFHKSGDTLRPETRLGNTICGDWVDLALMDRADVWPFALPQQIRSAASP